MSQVTGLARAAPPERIRSARLELRRHAEGFGPLQFAYVESDRERLREFLPWVDQTASVADSEGYVSTARERWDARELFDFGIFRREDGAYLGNVGVHTIAWDHRRCELGYWILGAYARRGYMSEAVEALEVALFGMGFNRIEIHCSSANERSAAVPRRRGFTLEGTLREDLVEDGRYRSTLIFGKLARDGAPQPRP